MLYAIATGQIMTMVGICVCVCLCQGVVDGVLEVDLYDQEMYLECGVNTPLLYQPLIDRCCMKLNRYVIVCTYRRH